MNTASNLYPIGTPGKPWGESERAAWRTGQQRQRSYTDDVISVLGTLGNHLEVLRYGELDYAPDHYELCALRSAHWRENLPCALITGGVHGYETSGVMGALAFAAQESAHYADRINLLIAPCVSPWGYERIHRWNPDAVDPNRSFVGDGGCAEASALIQLVSPLRTQFLLHIDLHETTDTDESEFRPALAARDGKVNEPGEIPDGFYTVGDAGNPQPAFQQAVISAVSAVTHIAPADQRGEIIGSPMVSPGVILYPFRDLGLCAGVTDAPFTTTTEVYPDSPNASPDICNAAQVAAVCGAVEFALGQA